MRETKSPAAAEAQRGAVVDSDTGSRLRSREARAEGPARDQEPTRMVTYESTVDGQVAHDETRATRRTSPGREMGWEEDDESTYVYAKLEADEPLRAKVAHVAPVAPLRSSMNAPVLNWAPAQTTAAVAAPAAPPPELSSGAYPEEVTPVAPRPIVPMPVHVPMPVQAPPSRVDRRAKTVSTTAMMWLPVDDPVAKAALIRKLALAAVALGALVLAIVGVRALAGGADRSTIQITTEPLDAQVTLDGVLARGSASPFVLSEVTLDVPHTIAISKPGYRSWSTRITLRSERPVLLPNVHLVRESSRVEVLGVPTRYAAPPPRPAQAGAVAPAIPRRAPATPLLARPSAPRSAARPQPPIRASRPPAAPAATSARPGSQMATLRINSRPWSQVYVDGRLIGATPQMQIVLSPGAHTVTLINPDFGLKRVIALPLAPGQTVTKVVTLSN